MLLFLQACSLSQTIEPIALEQSVNMSNSDLVRARLYSQYEQWQASPYKYGGLSKQGVDCSGYIYQTYLAQLGYLLPRSSELLAKTGKKIDGGQLRAGDLVFFKTGFRQNHGGIYIENGQFVHVSSSSGVIISRLDNVYWSEKYWHARRIVD